jgi:hypothetical protein
MSHRPGCIKRCQVVKVNIMSSDLIGGYLTLYLNQPIKCTDFRLDALLADTMLTKLFVIYLHFDSLIDILTNATSSSAMSL